MPGGNCPYCNKAIKVERKGKQRCSKCGGQINVEITDTPCRGHEQEGFNTRTYLTAVNEPRQRDEDEQRWEETQKRRIEKKYRR